jgi:hypothetical protein
MEGHYDTVRREHLPSDGIVVVGQDVVLVCRSHVCTVADARCQVPQVRVLRLALALTTLMLVLHKAHYAPMYCTVCVSNLACLMSKMLINECVRVAFILSHPRFIQQQRRRRRHHQHRYQHHQHHQHNVGVGAADPDIMSNIANRTGGVEVNGRMLFGMDAELALKAQAKYDYALEKEIMAWIEQVIGEHLNPRTDIAEALKSGIVLIRLLNAIKPNTIKTWNTRSIPLMEMVHPP